MDPAWLEIVNRADTVVVEVGSRALQLWSQVKQPFVVQPGYAVITEIYRFLQFSLLSGSVIVIWYWASRLM